MVAKHVVDHKFKMLQKLAVRGASEKRLQRAMRAHEKVLPKTDPDEDDEMPF